MKAIYLSQRYLDALCVYKNVDLAAGFSPDAIFELFNEKDLSVIRAETIEYMKRLPLNLSPHFELHDRFNSVLLNTQVVSETAFAAPLPLAFAALDDKSILAFSSDECDEYSLVKAIEKGTTPGEIIGTPIWSVLLGMR